MDIELDPTRGPDAVGGGGGDVPTATLTTVLVALINVSQSNLDLNDLDYDNETTTNATTTNHTSQLTVSTTSVQIKLELMNIIWKGEGMGGSIS